MFCKAVFRPISLTSSHMSRNRPLKVLSSLCSTTNSCINESLACHETVRNFSALPPRLSMFSEIYCSITEIAELVADKIGNNQIKVTYDIAEDITKLGYANTLYMNLSVDKLKSLGWKPLTGLEEMFRRMIESCLKITNG